MALRQIAVNETVLKFSQSINQSITRSVKRTVFLSSSLASRRGLPLSISSRPYTRTQGLHKAENKGGRSQSELANKTMEIKEATTDAEILSCLPVYLGLRPHVKKEEFLSRVRKQEEEGFRLMFIKDPEDGKVKSILGFRTGNYLYSGKTLYVDDVATSEEGRGKGYAGALQDWVIAHAKQNGYNSLSLDSGYGPTRTAAHRLYLNKGYEIKSHHFHMHITD